MITVGDVADQNSGASAALDDFVLNFFKLALRSAQEKHIGSRLGESKGCHGAKTASGAGDERDAAVQPE